MLAGAAFCVQAFYAASDYYGDYWQPSSSVSAVPPLELAFDVWYLLHGGVFALLLAAAISASGAGEGLVTRVRQLARWRRLPALLVFLAGALSWLLRVYLLDRHAVTDDEETYRFIAHTLLEGRVVNPLPDAPGFYANQFVVLNQQGWFGKYPIGHPLLLALGLALGALDFVLPVLGGLTAWLSWKVGRALLGPRRALGGLALIVLSPHFTWTHATLLSQPTSCFALMLGTFALVRWARTRRVLLACLAGAAFAFGLLARPMPGVLFAALGFAFVVSRLWRRERRAWGPALAAFCLPLVMALAAFALIHIAQSGSPLTTGYHGVQGNLGVPPAGLDAAVAQSVFAGILRENFWLFGWPLSLLPVLASRPRRGRLLLYGPLVAELIYRIAVPKTVVSTTGPTYLMEAVPALALLASDGLARVQLFLRRSRLGPRAELVPLLTLTATVAMLLFFLPVQVSSVQRGVRARGAVFQLLEQAGAPRALVFANLLVDPKQYLTWAYHPPNPTPRFDEPYVFLRWPSGPGVANAARAHWRTKFPDRPAFVFVPTPEPRLIPLDSIRQGGTQPKAPAPAPPSPPPSGAP